MHKGLRGMIKHLQEVFYPQNVYYLLRKIVNASKWQYSLESDEEETGRKS